MAAVVLSRPAHALMIGTTLDGKYAIESLLGEGGMGAVYSAKHVVTGRQVAVKVIRTVVAQNATAVDRFLREARVVVESQHVVQTFDAGKDPATGWPYIVMEFLSGEDVQQLTRRVGPLAPELALRIAAQACLGLAKAHAAGIVHRDIKPANIYLARIDGQVVVKILDFGIAKSTEADEVNKKLTKTGSVLGSPSYMSPQQINGDAVDGRTDLWSLGIVMYEMLTGLGPFHQFKTIHRLIAAICTEPPAPLQDHAPWVMPEIVEIVEGAMQRPVELRFRDAHAMFERIKGLLPHGSLTIGEEMLVALGPQIRAVRAPRFHVRDASAPSHPMPEPTAAVPIGYRGLPLAEVPAVAGHAPPRARSVLPIALASAVIALGAGGAVAYAVRQHGLHPTPTVDSAETASGVAAPTNTPPDMIRTVRVRVPAAAAVELDGTPASAVAGVVEITGRLGSRHKIRVFVGEREATVDVAILDDGPSPTSIDLPVLSTPPTSSPATAIAPTKPAEAQPGVKLPPHPVGRPNDGRSTKFE